MKKPIASLAAGLGVVLPLAVLSRPASADESGYRDCMGRSSSTVASIECQKAELALLEGELNATYQKVLGALPADQQQKLRTAERLWVEFRRADCDVFYGKETGSYASIQAGECLIEHARQRIKALNVIVTP